MPPSSDVDLKACCRGDPQAWHAFVQSYGHIIYAAVQRTFRARGRITHRGATVDDVAQDVFVRLVKEDFRLLRSFDPRKASLSTWLTLVARSTTIDHLRKAHDPTIPIDESLSASAPPRAPSAALAGETILPAFPPDLLSPRQKLVLDMSFDQQRTVPEIARALSIDEQTVRSTRHKAIEKLRNYFADHPQQ
jgi:RNA polymerase sigma-70 factor (ECF subfamily)